MGDILSKGNLLPETIVSEMFSKVRGHSSLAKLVDASPLPFAGVKEFVFSLDKEADIVAENGGKTNGGATATPVAVIPVKFEYGARVSDEFLYGAEEYQLSVLKQFAEGAARKFARGLDIAAIHGKNPRTGEASAVVGDNCFDSKVTNIVTYDATAPDTNIESALTLIEAGDGMATGIAISPAMRSAIASLTVNGARKYPEFAFGATPGNLGGMAIDVNTTVNAASSPDHAVIGDFANAFKWGYAKEIPLKVIEYGNPDNDPVLGDLQGHNQVYLRCEVYIGWGILAPEYFALVKNS